MKTRKWMRTLKTWDVRSHYWESLGTSWPKAWEAQTNIGCLLEAVLGHAARQPLLGENLERRCASHIISFYVGCYEALNRDAIASNDLKVLDELYSLNVPIKTTKADELIPLATPNSLARRMVLLFRAPSDVYNAKLLRNSIIDNPQCLCPEAPAMVRKRLRRPDLK